MWTNPRDLLNSGYRGMVHMQVVEGRIKFSVVVPYSEVLKRLHEWETFDSSIKVTFKPYHHA